MPEIFLDVNGKVIMPMMNVSGYELL